MTDDGVSEVRAPKRNSEHLGEALVLPPAFEHLREQVEPILTPLSDTRPWARTG